MTRRLDIALRLVTFVLTVTLAVVCDWVAGDLIWSIWSSSLAYGVVYGLLLINCNPAEVDAPKGWRNPGRMLVLIILLVFTFGLFHLFQGLVLESVLPMGGDTEARGTGVAFPLRAFGTYWPFVVSAFVSRSFELVAVTRPSQDPHRLLAPFRQVAVMQVMVFVFLFMAAAGVVCYALYPILAVFYLPAEDVRRVVRNLFGKLENTMNDPGD